MKHDPSTMAFPVLAIIFAAIAWQVPDIFIPLDFTIFPLLMVIMFTMGMTLHVQDFIYVIRHPVLLLLGTGLQFIFMPLLAFAVSRWLELDNELLAGMMLVGASAGGTASNVIT